MTFAEFKGTLTQKKPPAGLPPALVALWWAGKDQWDKAHQIVMDEGNKECAWVHAYLHRVEGDLGNAGTGIGKRDVPCRLSRLPQNGARSRKPCWRMGHE